MIGRQEENRELRRGSVIGDTKGIEIGAGQRDWRQEENRDLRREERCSYRAGKKGTEICRIHVAPLASRPVKTIGTDDGTAMFAAFILAESVPRAASAALPKKSAIEPA